MPTAVFLDKEIIEAIAQTTGFRPKIIIHKEITEENRLAVIWR